MPWRRRPDLTAVLAMNENALFGILGELASSGLHIPDDVSVVSMVTSPQVAELATPALTTLTSPGSALGRLAVEALLRRWPAQADKHQQLLPCALESGRPAPARSLAASTTGPPPDSVRGKTRRRAATRRRAEYQLDTQQET